MILESGNYVHILNVTEWTFDSLSVKQFAFLSLRFYICEYNLANSEGRGQVIEP